MQASVGGLAQWNDPLRHHRVSALLGRIIAAEGPPGPVERLDLWPAHIRADHRSYGGNAAAHGIGLAAVAAIDAVGAGVPAGAAEP